jgi:membrane-associated protein
VGFALEQIGALPSVAVVLVMGAAMFIDVAPLIGLLLPADLLVVTVVANSDGHHAVLVMAGVVLGTLLGWSVFFLLGGRIGPRLRRSRVGRWIGESRWDGAERLITGRGARSIAVVQFLPVLNAVVPMVAGGLGMRYRQFIRFAVPGTTLWALVYGMVGIWAGLASDAVFGEDASPLATMVFAAPGFVAGSIGLAFLRRGLANRRATA